MPENVARFVCGVGGGDVGEGCKYWGHAIGQDLGRLLFYPSSSTSFHPLRESIGIILPAPHCGHAL
jgi:hypothetical protein